MMSLGRKRSAGKALAWSVMAAGALVIIGSALELGAVESLAPAWTPMKITTAFSFILAGASLYFIIRALEGGTDAAQTALPIAAMSLVLLMGVLCAASLIGVEVGVEHFFADELAGGAPDPGPDIPSYPTLGAFLLIGAAGFATVMDPEGSPRARRGIGWVVGGLGAAALLGHAARVPDSGMALHAAVLFLLLGIGLRCP